MIGCEYCRQPEDEGIVLEHNETDLGFFGTIESSLTIWNYCRDDEANIEYAVWWDDGTPTGGATLAECGKRIAYCPFCGANLKQVRAYERD